MGPNILKVWWYTRDWHSNCEIWKPTHTHSALPCICAVNKDDSAYSHGSQNMPARAGGGNKCHGSSPLTVCSAPPRPDTNPAVLSSDLSWLWDSLCELNTVLSTAAMLGHTHSSTAATSGSHRLLPAATHGISVTFLYVKEMERKVDTCDDGDYEGQTTCYDIKHILLRRRALHAYWYRHLLLLLNLAILLLKLCEKLNSKQFYTMQA